MDLRKYIFTLFLFSSTYGLAAQPFTINGRILDLQSQQPVPGATIQLINGVKHSAVSDNDGTFQLKTDKESGELHITMTGYQPQEVPYKIGNTLHIQMQVDVRSLTEVRVTAYGNKSIKETAGSIALVSGAQMRQGDGTSMQQAFNSIPGVRFDHSDGQDSKIAIRGEGVRAPWGNRSIKIYVNDIPLTETDGTSRIEALDVADLGQAEIIKGPASSLYGGGVGGVIKFRLERAPYQEQSVEAATMFGSFGLNSQTITYRNGGDEFNSFVSVGRQHTDGFRQHAGDNREFMAGNFQWFPNDKRTLTLLFSRTIQDAMIPGPLTATQAAENPKQSASGYIDKNASRNHRWTRIGVGQQYNFNKHLSNTSSVFTYFYDLHHPLPFGIINSTYQSFGGRTKFTYTPDFKLLPSTFTIGGEFNQALSMGNIYFNEHGIENGLMSNTDYKNRAYSVFYQSETSIGQIAKVVFGVSINGLTYHAFDRLHPNLSGVKRFNAEVAPRIALSHDFGNWLSLHGTISSGFTNPASDQIQNPDRSINRNIEAEKATNFEIDAKGNFFMSRLNYDLAVFVMNMRGELIGQSLPTGVTVFHNTGKTRHGGVELVLSYRLLKEEDNHFITVLYPHISVTYSHFRFNDYKLLDEDGHVSSSFDGNELTGIAPWMVSAGMEVGLRPGWYANANMFFNDSYPLDDANTDFNPSYMVLNVKAGFKKRLSRHFGINIYGGIQNFSNEKYSSFTAVNAPDHGIGSAYFNPAPAINGYGGFSLKYFFKNEK